MPEPVSAHASIREMYEYVKGQGLESVFDRFQAQEPTRCPYCRGGIRCSLCSNGPCRITKKASRGVCGIEANAMAMREMLIRNILGTATYTFHANEVAETLAATAAGKTPFTITDSAKLTSAAQALGLGSSNDTRQLAQAFASAMQAELNRSRWEPSRFIQAYAPASRVKKWDSLGMLPAGPLQELMRDTSSCLTNVDADYVSLATKALRLSLACIYGAQVPLELGQDILFGTAKPHPFEVDLGVLDPDYVNILASGHEPFVGVALIDAAHTPQAQQKARAAGAKGLRIIGSIETGQELIQRLPQDEVFAGYVGNWLNQEMVLATGAVDVMATDMNCTVPTLGFYAERFGSRLVPVSELVRIEKCDQPIDYRPEKVAEQAQELIRRGVENFARRKANGKGRRTSQKRTAVVGFSAESILAALGGSLDPLLDVIKNGTVKGVVALVSCTTLGNGPQDSMTIGVATELVKRDLLVLGMGCGVAGLQLGGLCSPEARNLAGPGLKAVCGQLGVPPVLSFGTCTDTGRVSLLVTAVANALGVDPSQLPVAVTAPEYMEQKATIDAIFALAFGLYTHVSPVPPVTGAPALVKFLTQDVEGLLGGKLAVEGDAVAAVDGIEAHILSKRKALGI
jgi:carbon-monoxide dehydrogenase catalytic subunit